MQHFQVQPSNNGICILVLGINCSKQTSSKHAYGTVSRSQSVIISKRACHQVRVECTNEATICFSEAKPYYMI